MRAADLLFLCLLRHDIRVDCRKQEFDLETSTGFCRNLTWLIMERFNKEPPQKWLVDMNPHRIVMSTKGSLIKL